MLRKLTKRGFTLIELMIVVAIIGILAAIAIPNFIRFQARSKQGEAKANLKAMFTAERSFFQEKDRYSSYLNEVGFSPERANRYAYRLDNACAAVESRAPTLVTTPNDTCISVDFYKYTSVASPGMPANIVGTNTPNAGLAGVFGAGCPVCDIMGTAAGNIDNDSGQDSWFISTLTPSGAVGAVCGNTESAAPAGTPFNVYNDVNCP
jgi:type IV pilus assembly protein PilA